MELKFINEFNESQQYRTKTAIATSNAREVADFAFMDLIGLWILFNEYEFAPAAIEYADKTSMFGRFTGYRQMGTDLYMNLHILTQKRTDLLSTENDEVLLDKIDLDSDIVIRYLKQISKNRITDSMVRITLQRIEQSLHISDSNYRSVRRLAQNWSSLHTAQKRTVLTRMLFFYRSHARRSEIYMLLSELAKSKNLVDPDAKDPENRIGVGTALAVTGAAMAGGYIAGYRLGKRF